MESQQHTVIQGSGVALRKAEVNLIHIFCLIFNFSYPTFFGDTRALIGPRATQCGSCGCLW